ncbi:MAG: proline dehydrogenase [Bacillati bacterium ANGP1]|uniref:proline dehydrogenase n=1 Tax=Candidatus Segetimicrobium genomatis TaxID=2569760 RepID=A0A537J7Z9_9BACT|nr:MAG: proline dehydrogenase [Terrabacteria group bacterium ANGP1]
MLRPIFLALSRQPGLARFALRHPILRRTALRFVAGERLDEAVEAVRGLNAAGLAATLDHLGENTTTRGEAEGSAAEYLAILDELHRTAADNNLSLKLTQLGLDLDAALCEAHLRRILDGAGATFVRIDMEGSPYTERTLGVFERMWAAGYRNVGVVIQSYLRRSVSDVERLIALGARVRLVKGAYAEPPSVAFPHKRDVDAAFARLAEQLLRRGAYPAIATHDERLIAAARRVASAHGIGPDRFEFQMLYGIRRDLQMRLRREGHRVRIYVPFGREWYPYFMRRLAERPANVMFVLGSLVRERGERGAGRGA